MLKATIENKLAVAIGAGTEYPLPEPFAWMAIAAAPATGEAVVREQDLFKLVSQTTGFSAGDLLQQMVQKGQVAVTYAVVANDIDLEGKAVGTEAP